MDNGEIKLQARKIMDSFAKALENISTEETKVERDKDRREEKEGEISDKKFREIFFENAPNSEDDCIIAERGEWV